MKKRFLIPVALFLLVGVFASRDEAAAECIDAYGESRPCSHTEEYDECLEYAIDAAELRAGEEEGTYLTRFIWFSVDIADCTASYILPFF